MNRKQIAFNESYRLKRMAHLAKGLHTILDIGYVDCPNIYLNNSEVIGLDIKEGHKPKNYSRIVTCNIKEFIKCNHKKINGIIVGEVMEHLEEPINFLRDCYNILEIGGKLIISTPNPNSFIEQILTLTLNQKYYYTQDHIMLFPQRWLIRMLKLCKFNKIQLFSGGFPVPLFGLIPFPRPWCYQTIALSIK